MGARDHFSSSRWSGAEDATDAFNATDTLDATDATDAFNALYLTTDAILLAAPDALERRTESRYQSVRPAQLVRLARRGLDPPAARACLVAPWPR